MAVLANVKLNLDAVRLIAGLSDLHSFRAFACCSTTLHPSLAPTIRALERTLPILDTWEVEAYGSSVRQVKRSDLSHDITDATISCKLSAYQTIHLHTVNLSGCFKLGASGLRRLSQLPNLTSLNLSKCHNLFKISIAPIGLLYKTLKHLNLSKIALVSISNTIAKLTELRSLDLSFTNVQSDMISIIGTRLLKLTELNVAMSGIDSHPSLKELKGRMIVIAGVEDLKSKGLAWSLAGRGSSC